MTADLLCQVLGISLLESLILLVMKKSIVSKILSMVITGFFPIKLTPSLVDGITCVAISPDNRLIVSGREDGSIKIIGVQSRKQVYFFKNVHEGPVSSVVITPDNKFIISSSHDRSIKIFDNKTKKQVHHFENAHEGIVNKIVVTPDSQWLISASQDGTIKMFDIAKKDEYFHFKEAHKGIG